MKLLINQKLWADGASKLLSLSFAWLGRSLFSRILPVAQKDKPIDHDNPIRVFPDGSMWCAVSGDDIESGHATFDRSPIKALEKLLNIDDVIQVIPHAVWEVDCEKCGHHEVSVAPYPIWGEKLECSQCGYMNFVEQDVM